MRKILQELREMYTFLSLTGMTTLSTVLKDINLFDNLAIKS